MPALLSRLPGKRAYALALGLAAAVSYLAMTTRHLDGVGLYYDEVNQAPAAFAYVGHQPTMFSALSIGALPLMNASYIGALKSGIYGLYMRTSGRPFTVFSWRMTGILLVACGLVAFSLASASRLSLPSLALFFALLLTDVGILLTTRHDYGPAALCLLFRLLILSLWLHAWRDGSSGRAVAHPLHAAGLGCLLGVALFEKATAVVLLPALLVYMFLGPSRRLRSHWAALGLGLAVGAVPLILSNSISFIRGGGLISFYPIAKPWRGLASSDEMFSFLRDYLSLGQGRYAAWWILDLPSGKALADLEAVILTGLLGLTLYDAFLRKDRGAPVDRLAGTMAVSYLATGAALLLLPYRTEFHHQLLGTPFQYIALALCWSEGRSPVRTGLTAGITVKRLLLLLLVLLRLPAVARMQRAITDERAGVTWDRSFTALARFAARQADRAVFVAADWGFATQIYCMAQAKENLVFEPYREYSGPADLGPILKAAADKKEIYILSRKFRPPLNPSNTERLTDDLLALKGWRRAKEVVDPQDSRAICVIKLVRRAEAAAAPRAKAGTSRSRRGIRDERGSRR